ncbi:uncharacterized protein LOC106636704 [Copidosoma floridanum]|uniref:uncharacterized protein LOC106636704 n=1 Tax=Copidosoma floridanum TaxID=29053 RepID=UPI0006C9695E|nr:uncharacterized protein LOC106636704 [Copidosoma floridanum]
MLENMFNTLFAMAIFVLSIVFSILPISILDTEDYFERIRLSVMVFSMLAVIYLLSWLGQRIIDESDNLFLATYTGQWYQLSEKSKVLLKIMRYRSVRPCVLTAGIFFALNHENFVKIVKTGFSYMACLRSVRQ